MKDSSGKKKKDKKLLVLEAFLVLLGVFLGQEGSLVLLEVFLVHFPAVSPVDFRVLGEPLQELQVALEVCNKPLSGFVIL